MSSVVENFVAADYTECDSFEEAIAAVATDLAEPPVWNAWQRLTAMVRTSYPGYQWNHRALAALRKVTMEDSFFSGWSSRVAPTAALKERILAAVAEEPAAGDPGQESGGAGAIGAPGEEGAAGLGAENALGGARQRAEGGASGAAPSGAGASLGDTAITPMVPPGGASVARELRDNAFTSAFDEHRPERDSETSSQCDTRVRSLRAALAELGGSQEMVSESARMECLKRDLTVTYLSERRQAAARGGERQTLQA